MRALLVALFAFAFVQAATAQIILKREPHYLATGAVVFVESGRCGAGKVMKVTGISKGTSRRKTCVPLNPRQATLAFAPAL